MAVNRTALLVTGFVLLALVAVAGWVRTPAPAAAAVSPLNLNSAAGYAQPAGYPATAANPVAGTAAVPCVDSAAYAGSDDPIVYYPSEQYVRRPVRVVRREYVERPVVTTTSNTVTSRPVVRRERSVKKSVAIVAGSSGVGAAIGALTGGGKGAAIGALAGGTGGFIYDRLTHRR